MNIENTSQSGLISHLRRIKNENQNKCQLIGGWFTLIRKVKADFNFLVTMKKSPNYEGF